jgi:hypothetical protein
MELSSIVIPVVTVLPGVIECLKSWMFRRATCVSTCEGKINRVCWEPDDKGVNRETSECKIYVR